MNTQTLNKKYMRLRFNGIEHFSSVLTFSGSKGEFSPHPQLPYTVFENRTIQAELFLADSDEKLWAGRVNLKKISTTFFFEMLISAENTDDHISWSEVPQILSVFDGGYTNLHADGASAALSDLIEFNELVSCKIHYGESYKNKIETAKLSNQDNLKTLSEVLFISQNSDPKPKGIVALIELELFEITYFFVSVLNEQDENLLIFSLTQHIYTQTNRFSKRTALSEKHRIKTSLGEILEISDFGMKIQTDSESVFPGGKISIEIKGLPIPFQVIYVTSDNPNALNSAGLYLHEDSPEIRNVWQSLLLEATYPLLSRRSESNNGREKCWDLLKESGYFRDYVGEMVASNKSSVYREWEIVDENGPHLGSCVLGFHNEQAVATMGVSRVAGTVWTAQAAAVIDRPEYLDFTRSIYSWRTRTILQQKDGDFHLAFFSANKPFLDRFFRKFFLKHESTSSEISWTEWIFGFLSRENGATEADAQSHEKKSFLYGDVEPFHTLMLDTENNINPSYTKNTVALHARPHQHLAQFLSSVWCMEKYTSDELKNQIASFPREISQITVFFEKENSAWKEISELSNLVVSKEKEVVWICKRRLLPSFLSNSLRSLEQMSRKYRPKNAA